MELKCKFESFSSGDPSKNCYTCSIQQEKDQATITEPGTIISNFKGKHEANKKDSDVNAVSFLFCKITYIPLGLSIAFENLKELSMYWCGLVSLSRMDLIGLEGLEWISISGNPLTSLPSDLFRGFRKLKKISFAANKLEFLSSKLLEPILQNELECVDFSSNTKINASFSIRRNDTSLKQLMDLIDENCKKPTTVLKKPEGDPGFDLEHFDNNFVKSFGEMWKSGAFTDFTIITKNSKEIPVHKCVLGMQSPVFRAAISIDMEEKRTSRMVIDKFRTEAVEQFLGFLYTGRVPDDLHAMELFALAAEYDVPKLKMKCGEVVKKNLDQTNAYEIFTLGHLHSEPDMMEKAFKMIRESMPDKSLDECYKDDVDGLANIVAAAREHSRKMQAADEEFNTLKKAIVKRSNKKH